MQAIQFKVGKPTECSNFKPDVVLVQNLLKAAADRLRDPSYDPGEPDGVVGRNTMRAITSFQDRFMHRPDGVISPNGRTIRELADFAGWAIWRKLNLFAFGHDEPAPPARGTKAPPRPEERRGMSKALEIARTAQGCCFPIPMQPMRDMTTGARYFGAPRKDKNGLYRLHGAVDLICPVGTPIFAVADGVVKTKIRHFYRSTGEFAIDHGTFWVRYCEIAMKASRELGLEPGTKVKKGQLIGFIGIMRSSSMLHCEMYSGEATGTLATRAHKKPHTRTVKDAPFNRRRDLIDPTPFLKTWIGNLPVLTQEVKEMAEAAKKSAIKARDAHFARLDAA